MTVRTQQREHNREYTTRLLTTLNNVHTSNQLTNEAWGLMSSKNISYFKRDSSSDREYFHGGRHEGATTPATASSSSCQICNAVRRTESSTHSRRWWTLKTAGHDSYPHNHGVFLSNKISYG